MFSLPNNRPALMGILNVTPDSFSDGGVHFETQTAIDAAKRMIDEGADIIDVGGESTRPNSEGVSEEEELRRVMPVIQALTKAGIPTSIDTAKSNVAKESLNVGAVVVNDITAFSDPDMAAVCAAADCPVCLMHMQGTPRTMQKNPSYEDVVREVKAFLIQRAELAQQNGIKKEHIWIDPGIGFGKTVEHNLQLLKHIQEFVETGYPVLIGTSRKSFLGKLLGTDNQTLPSDQRLEGTIATQIWAQMNGAKIIRAHDVLATRRAMDITTLLMH
jgi:dihydropteroate synthase